MNLNCEAAGACRRIDAGPRREEELSRPVSLSCSVSVSVARLPSARDNAHPRTREVERPPAATPRATAMLASMGRAGAGGPFGSAGPARTRAGTVIWFDHVLLPRRACTIRTSRALDEYMYGFGHEAPGPRSRRKRISSRSHVCRGRRRRVVRVSCGPGAGQQQPPPAGRVELPQQPTRQLTQQPHLTRQPSGAAKGEVA